MNNEIEKEDTRSQQLEDRGIFILSGDIKEDLIEDAIRFIIERNVIDVIKAKELKFIINSCGGDLASAFALVDVMNSSAIPIATNGFGSIASSGLVIFMNGAKGKRFLGKNTSVLSHRFSWSSGGKSHEMKSRNKEVILTEERMINHYMKCSGMSRKNVIKHLLPAEDVWLTVEEAVNLGVADYIL